jgi:uncharacterized membrane protein YukC
MASNLKNVDSDTTMAEVLKKERIAKIENKIKNNDRKTIKAILEWIATDDRKEKARIEKIQQENMKKKD